MEPMEEKTATLTVKDNTLFISGVIDFDNVVSLRQEGVALIDALKETKEFKVDLKALKQSDSSGIALLTDFVRVSQEKNKTIVFINMPDFMVDIVQVCGLEGVLPALWEN